MNEHEHSDCTKRTVYLTKTSLRALEDAAALSQESVTDAINAAVQVYCLLLTYKSFGHRVFVGRGRLSSGELSWSWGEREDE